MTKYDKHMEICKALNALYQAKNKDYGDSFAKARSEVPCYTLGKLYDKFHRYMNLTQSGSAPQVKGESIMDTLLDMANYCIMEVVEMTIANEEVSKKSDLEKFWED